MRTPKSPEPGISWEDVKSNLESEGSKNKVYDPSLLGTIPLSEVNVDQDLAMGAHSIELEETLASNQTATGIIIDSVTAGENLVFKDLVYLKAADSRFWKTDADLAATTDGILGIVLETINAGSTGKILLYGFVRDNDWAWTVGQWLYVGLAGGDITAIAPSDTGDQVRKVGVAYTADMIFFHPDSTVLEVA